jgi:hypothetical protein
MGISKRAPGKQAPRIVVLAAGREREVVGWMLWGCGFVGSERGAEGGGRADDHKQNCIHTLTSFRTANWADDSIHNGCCWQGSG